MKKGEKTAKQKKLELKKKKNTHAEKRKAGYTFLLMRWIFSVPVNALNKAACTRNKKKTLVIIYSYMNDNGVSPTKGAEQEEEHVAAPESPHYLTR